MWKSANTEANIRCSVYALLTAGWRLLDDDDDDDDDNEIACFNVR